jgi:SagB-type dehydrogenase family enzyme
LNEAVPSMDKTREIIRYHEETKHHFHRYAKSLGYMDWKNQPNPFRFYEHVKTISLPLPEENHKAEYMDLYTRKNTAPQSFTLENISRFMAFALGLSAWKAISGSKWSLRMNPSSGNLHPTEAHLVLPATDLTPCGVYHYNPLIHALEQRTVIPGDLWESILNHFQTQGFMAALSSIFWRESWKYGERGFRYCNHDTGHALAGLSFSASLLGWRVTVLNALSDKDIGNILGFDRTAWHALEKEAPELLCFVHTHEKHTIPRGLPVDIIDGFSRLLFDGIPNLLSDHTVNWEIIYKTEKLTEKPPTPEKRFEYGHRKFIDTSISSLDAAQIIRQRRSAVSFNPGGRISKRRFMAMLDKTLPRDRCAPFDAELSDSNIHLFIFVHKVREILPGLYFFIRNDHHLKQIRDLAKPDFLWRQIDPGFPLYLLEHGEFRRTAMAVSCHQDIAGDGVFSLGMIARFKSVLDKEPFRYRRLFWESGMVGQVLYLEAEAHGLRGTGIGCFFDDPVHDLLGFEDNAFQSLYHFTVGDPVEDHRLTTYPPYYHLSSR